MAQILRPASTVSLSNTAAQGNLIVDGQLMYPTQGPVTTKAANQTFSRACCETRPLLVWCLQSQTLDKLCMTA